jgi:hypothetical protein
MQPQPINDIRIHTRDNGEEGIDYLMDGRDVITVSLVRTWIPTDHPWKVEINWSACGAQPVDVARKFSDLMQRALMYAADLQNKADHLNEAILCSDRVAYLPVDDDDNDFECDSRRDDGDRWARRYDELNGRPEGPEDC